MSYYYPQAHYPASYGQSSQHPAFPPLQRPSVQPQSHYYENSLSAPAMIATKSQGSTGSSSSGHTYPSSASSPGASPTSYQPSQQYQQGLPRGGQSQLQSRRNISPRQSSSRMSRGKTTRAPAPQSHPSNPTSPTTKAHICLHPGCLSSFARAYDLDRHQKTHFPATAKRYDCQFAPVCNRYGERTEKWKGGFTREDHYIEHLRKVHGEDIAKGRRRSGGGGQVLGVRGCS